MAIPLPDGTYVTFANQNGKLFERIRTDFASGTFVHDTAATLNLATCTNAKWTALRVLVAAAR